MGVEKWGSRGKWCEVSWLRLVRRGCCVGVSVVGGDVYRSGSRRA